MVSAAYRRSRFGPGPAWCKADLSWQSQRASVLDCFGYVRGADWRDALQISDGAGYFEYTMVGPC